MNPSHRPFVLQILTALLAAVFVMPACITSALWRDNRTRQSEELAAPVVAHSYFDTTTKNVVHIEFAPAVASRLAELGALPSQTHRWVSLRLGADALPAEIDRQVLHLRLVVEEDGSSPIWRVWFSEWASKAYEAGHRLGEVRTCDAPPAYVGKEFPGTTVELLRVLDNGTWLVARIALTPGTLVVDVLLFAVFWPLLL